MGRIYKELMHGEAKWKWSLQSLLVPLPNTGHENILEECKAAFKQRYEQVMRPSQSATKTSKCPRRRSKAP
jgi:hypothetical protein